MMTERTDSQSSSEPSQVEVERHTGTEEGLIVHPALDDEPPGGVESESEVGDE